MLAPGYASAEGLPGARAGFSSRRFFSPPSLPACGCASGSSPSSPDAAEPCDNASGSPL